jgi:predicted nucleic acid-binding protein
MYLLDTNVISEHRKKDKADPGVRLFFKEADQAGLYLPVQVLGEIRGGIEKLRRRRDFAAVKLLEDWLDDVMRDYADRILNFDLNCAQVWGQFLIPKDPHAIDKQLASMALTYDMTLVTRNVAHVESTGVRTHNPFAAAAITAPNITGARIP